MADGNTVRDGNGVVPPAGRHHVTTTSTQSELALSTIYSPPGTGTGIVRVPTREAGREEHVDAKATGAECRAVLRPSGSSAGQAIRVVMATITSETRRCGVCGKTSTQGFVVEAGREGSADLDLRPPPDQRETIAHWVRECPHCGYCGLALEEPTAGAAEVMASDEYRALRAGSDPELVTRLLCASTLLEHAERWVEATETAVWAAWAADDAGANDAARRARRRALDLFGELQLRGEHYIDDPGAEVLVMVDLARRAGEFDRGARLAEGLGSVNDPRFAAIVAFQQARIAAGDTGRYTVADAIGGDR